jgi:ABC-type multidrug transport system ATPase subunit
VIKTLQNLARNGRTIIVTIHQPRSEIWNLFDNVVLLSRGSPAYAGSAKDCLPYFAKLGHEMPPFTNPAEYLIDVVSVDNRSVEAEKAAQERVGRVIEAWRSHCNNNLQEKHESATPATTMTKTERQKRRASQTSLIQQTRVLTARTWTVTIRDPMGKTFDMVVATDTHANSFVYRHVRKSC